MAFGVRAFRATTFLLLTACGARSPLRVGDTTGPADGGSGPTSGGVGPSTTGSTGGGGSSGEPDCRLDDLSTWHAERYRDDGDYERAAVAVGGSSWVALKVRDGNVVLAELGIDDGQGIAFRNHIELADSPVYPVALDVDDRRFVLLTTSGINWNGDVELWRIDRKDGTVLHTSVGNPPTDPAYTIYSAIGLAGEEVVLAYARAAENQGTIELRDDQLGVLQSLSVNDVSFTAVRASDSAVDIYAGTDLRVHVEAGALTQEPADPEWEVIGGLGGFLVEIGDDIRLTEGDSVWSGPWPHSQISPPAVVRTDGRRAAFSLETELTAVVGHMSGTALDWLAIDPATDAPGLGVGLLPVIEQGRLGLFYLGLEIPSPQQPLRYFGLTCGAPP